jgi:hypothetical protein
MEPNPIGVPLVSRKSENHPANGIEVIDSEELAARLKLPESWIRSRARSRTPKHQRIPCVKFGRYIRFEWGSAQLSDWISKQRQ